MIQDILEQRYKTELYHMQRWQDTKMYQTPI